MPTRAEIRESEAKCEAELTADEKKARDGRRAIRAKVKAKAKELNAMRPQPPGNWIEHVLDGIRNGQTFDLGPPAP